MLFLECCWLSVVCAFGIHFACLFVEPLFKIDYGLRHSECLEYPGMRCGNACVNRLSEKHILQSRLFRFLKTE